jgi:hypothetical protein
VGKAVTTVILALVASYVVLAVLTLAMLVYSRAHWISKAAVIVLVSAFYPVSYFSFMALLGWPTAQSLPERFRLVSAQVYEPDERSGRQGAIYLWVASLSESAGRVTPRAFEVSYSEGLHQKVESAKKSLEQGAPQMGEVKEEESTGLIPLKITDLSRTAAVATDITFTTLSGTMLPEK